jgi:two-component system NtrC family sensor kinase
MSHNDSINVPTALLADREGHLELCSLDFLLNTLDGSTDPIFVKDRRHRWVLLNSACCEFIGHDRAQLLGKTDYDFFPHEEADVFWEKDEQVFATGVPDENEEQITDAEGNLHIISTRKSRFQDEDGNLFIVATIRDITARVRSEEALHRSNDLLHRAMDELKKAQGQIIQTEKMSSLGQLIAGIAHEINNPVNFIHGNLSHAQNYAQDLLNLVQLYQKHYPHPVPEIQSEADEIDLEFLQKDFVKILNSMYVGTDRIREIVLSLRNFSRTDEAGFKKVDIHEGIESTLLILQHRLKATPQRAEIQVVKDYGKLPLIECYAGQLNQVFMNILANAIDALEEAMVAQTFQTASLTITIHTDLIGAEQVVVRIRDNGLGIQPSVLQRLFDPFFTTKPVGKGTGLGMSLSYQIVTEGHHGVLDCISEPGAGAEFVIQLPLRQSSSI